MLTDLLTELFPNETDRSLTVLTGSSEPAVRKNPLIDQSSSRSNQYNRENDKSLNGGDEKSPPTPTAAHFSPAAARDDPETAVRTVRTVRAPETKDDFSNRPIFEAVITVRNLAEGLSRLQAMSYPADIDIDRWSLFLSDAADFVAVWWRQAERTGWRPSDLFAVPGGLCWALEGREVVALSIEPGEATLRAKDASHGPGATTAFHRPVKPMPLPWEQQP